MPVSTNVFMTVCGEDAEIARFVEMLRGVDRLSEAPHNPFSYLKTTASAAGYFAFYGLCDHIGAVLDVLTAEYPTLCFCGSAGRDGQDYGIFTVRSGEVPEWKRYDATPEMTAGEFPNRHFTTRG
jgi:hypothetical protein